MKVCIFPSCVKREERTPEKSFSEVPLEKGLPKQCDRRVKIDDFTKNTFVCEDDSDFEKDVDKYLTVQQKNKQPVLNKDTVPHNFLGSKQEINNQQRQEIWEEAAMKSSMQAPLKDIRVSVNMLNCGSYSQKEEKQLPDPFSCMLCKHCFSSQNSLAAHFNHCITHQEIAHGSSSGSAANCMESNDLGKPAPVEMYDCKVCSAKVDVKRICERHQAKCEYQQEKEDQKSVQISSVKPELPIFYYCNICFVGFDEERAWECHLAKCEYRPKEEKKVQNAVTTSCTKDPSKDVIHEKVIEDESWLVTSLPQGYECVDAMFVVEAEGTCMLQRQIPVEPEEQQLEVPDEHKEVDVLVPDRGISPIDKVLEEQKEQDVLVPDRGLSPLEKDLLPPWSMSLLAGALEAEEEKEMMEQKMVLEPHLMRSAFMCVKGRLSEDYDELEKEPPKDPLIVTKVPEDENEPIEAVEEDACPVADFINVKIEPEELQIKVACH